MSLVFAAIAPHGGMTIEEACGPGEDKLAIGHARLPCPTGHIDRRAYRPHRVQRAITSVCCAAAAQ